MKKSDCLFGSRIYTIVHAQVESRCCGLKGVLNREFNLSEKIPLFQPYVY